MFVDTARSHVCKTRNNIAFIKQPAFEPSNDSGDIKGYICDLCNYVRFYEYEIEAHLRNEHDGDIKTFQEFTFFRLPKLRSYRRQKCQEKTEEGSGSEDISDEEKEE